MSQCSFEFSLSSNLRFDSNIKHIWVLSQIFGQYQDLFLIGLLLSHDLMRDNSKLNKRDLIKMVKDVLFTKTLMSKEFVISFPTFSLLKVPLNTYACSQRNAPTAPILTKSLAMLDDNEVFRIVAWCFSYFEANDLIVEVSYISTNPLSMLKKHYKNVSHFRKIIIYYCFVVISIHFTTILIKEWNIIN